MKDEKKDNPAAEKSVSFALRIVKLYQHLSDRKNEFVLSKQVLRSGTSIGANLETAYWLRLLEASNFITERQFDNIYSDCSELIRVSGSTQLTMRRKLQKGNRP